ncbi:acyltransferase family protein [Mucilaginibacter ginkgonis]|uniref:Acyltransferase n=1 Tax=Mucilaginibacter ginkgonis TaxID=2682091 RepID=A0A6I4I6K8_9SPHI|nr:acyltransferase [Mucilaginibacter ginkgonis]QQL50856.1 acyltransferase [Mucilaginibacter ginkgonis]
MKAHRLEFLDSTRGLAALCVLLSHFIGAFNIPSSVTYLNSSIFHMFWNGAGAVSYFFVLSGFVLSFSHFKNIDAINNLNYPVYILKRFFRIYPAFLATLIISWLCVRYVFDISKLASLPEATEWIKLFWTEKKSVFQMLKEGLLIVRIPQEPEKRLINQDWTLTIELITSLLVPVLVLICKRGNLWLILAVGILLRVHTLNWIVDFSIGVIIAANIDVIKNYYKRTNLLLRVMFVLVAIVLFVSQFLFHLTATSADSLIKVANGMFLVYFISSERIQKVLAVKPLEFLGRISYSLYLCHFIFILVLAPILFNYLRAAFIVNDFATRGLALLSILSCTFLLSWLLYRFVEAPFIKASKKIFK